MSSWLYWLGIISQRLHWSHAFSIFSIKTARKLRSLHFSLTLLHLEVGQISGFNQERCVPAKLCFIFTLFLTSHPQSSSVEPWRHEHETQIDIVTSYRKFSFSHWNIPITIPSPNFRGHLLLPIKNSRQLQKIPAFLYSKEDSSNTLQYFSAVWLNRNFTLGDKGAKPHSKLTNLQ